MMKHVSDLAQSLFRVVVGMLFACHGAATMFGVLGGPMDGGPIPPAGQFPSWWAALIQLAGGALVTIGLGTRVFALVCSGSMAYAYFTVHEPKGLLPILNGGEPAALFSWAFFLIAVVGGGRWAVDRLLFTRRKQELVPEEHDDKPSFTLPQPPGDLPPSDPNWGPRPADTTQPVRHFAARS